MIQIAIARDGRLSALRVIATLMVITVHVSGMLAARWGQNGWWTGNILNSASRGCVPIFLMITGALLIPRNERFTPFILHRAVRLIPPVILGGILFSIGGREPARGSLASIGAEGARFSSVVFVYATRNALLSSDAIGTLRKKI